MKGIVLEFCCPLGVGEALPLFLTVVVVGTIFEVGLPTGVGSRLFLLTTGVGVGLSVLATFEFAVAIPPPPTIVEVKSQWVVYYVSV